MSTVPVSLRRFLHEIALKETVSRGFRRGFEFLEAQEDFSERGFEVLPRDIDSLRDGLKFFLWQSLVGSRFFIIQTGQIC